MLLFVLIGPTKLSILDSSNFSTNEIGYHERSAPGNPGVGIKLDPYDKVLLPPIGLDFTLSESHFLSLLNFCHQLTAMHYYVFLYFIIIIFIVFVNIDRKLGIFSNTIFYVILSDRFFPITFKDEIGIDLFHSVFIKIFIH